jgi:hypothetical protein
MLFRVFRVEGPSQPPERNPDREADQQVHECITDECTAAADYVLAEDVGYSMSHGHGHWL